MTFAVVRIRSPRQKQNKTEDTLHMLRLNRVNHCMILEENKETKGMLNRIKDVVTWGEIDKETLVMMLKKRSNLERGLKDEIVSDHTSYKNVDEFAQAVIDGEEKVDSIDGMVNLFRMHPPCGGFKGVKKPYNTGGSLGYRGEDINDLLQKMMCPDEE